MVCRPGAWIAGALSDTDVEVIESDLRRWPPRELSRIAQAIRTRNIQVVHTHMSSASFFGVLLRRLYGIPACVATAHNRYVQPHWMFNDRVIAVSQATRQFHQRYNLVRPSRIDVVYNFINDTRFHRVTREEGMQVRADLGVSADRCLIGVIGDVIPRKGQLHLIRALPRILQAVPHAHVLSVGNAREQYANQCYEEAERLQVSSRITWAGVRNDIERILAGLDVYALPSLEENMPLAILEAMASSRAVVATAVGGIPECVIHEQTGLLVPPAKGMPLADALIRLLTDDGLRERMGQAGRQRVRQLFSAESQVRQIEHVLKRSAA